MDRTLEEVLESLPQMDSVGCLLAGAACVAPVGLAQMVVKSKGIPPKSPKHSGVGIVIICPDGFSPLFGSTHYSRWQI